MTSSSPSRRGELYFSDRFLFFFPCLSWCLTDRSSFVINPAGDDDLSGQARETAGVFFLSGAERDQADVTFFFFLRKNKTALCVGTGGSRHR